ncbi:hypothetical protein NQZ68_021906 [Dissostichus eleginoides]|nr:hypothetical protein NQZ68_021906 [Dissostichus eleginoides]
MKDPSSSSLDLRDKDSEDHTFREKDLHEGSFLLLSRPQGQGLRRSQTSGTRTQKITGLKKRISMKDPSSSSLNLRNKDSEDHTFREKDLHEGSFLLFSKPQEQGLRRSHTSGTRTQKDTRSEKRISMKDPSSSSLDLRNKDSEDHTFREKFLHEGSFLLLSRPQEQGLRRSHTSGTRTQKDTRSEKRISMKDPSSSSLDLRDKDSEDTCSEKRISMKDPSSSSLNLRNKDSEDTRSEKRISMKDPSSSSLDLRNKDSEDHTFREKDLHEGSFLLLSRPQEQGLRRTHTSGTRTQKITRSEKRISMKDPSSSSLDLRDKDSEDHTFREKDLHEGSFLLSRPQGQGLRRSQTSGTRTQKITGLKKRISMKDPSSSSLNLRNKDSEDHTFREKDLHEGSFLLFSKPQEQGLRRSHTSGTRTQKITRLKKRISMKDPSSSSLDLRNKD